MSANPPRNEEPDGRIGARELFDLMAQERQRQDDHFERTIDRLEKQNSDNITRLIESQAEANKLQSEANELIHQRLDKYEQATAASEAETRVAIAAVAQQSASMANRTIGALVVLAIVSLIVLSGIRGADLSLSAFGVNGKTGATSEDATPAEKTDGP